MATREAIQQATIGDEDVDRLRRELHLMSRQCQLQQFNEEEKVRSDGNSGIKQIRTRNCKYMPVFRIKVTLVSSMVARHSIFNNITLWNYKEKRIRVVNELTIHLFLRYEETNHI